MSSMSISVPSTRLKRQIIYLGYPLSFPFAQGLVSWSGGVESLSAFSPLFCPLHHFFGIHCPTCGLTRSLIATWNFDFSTALKYHFLGPVIFFASLIAWMFFVLRKEQKLINGLTRVRQHPQFSFWFKSMVAIYVVWGFTLHKVG